MCSSSRTSMMQQKNIIDFPAQVKSHILRKSARNFDLKTMSGAGVIKSIRYDCFAEASTNKSIYERRQ